jgi:uncharacterized membrane protein YcaP (DUF421 family)
VLVGTIIFWNYLFDWLSYRSEWFGRLIQQAPLALIKDGKMLRQNMRQEFITEDELMMELRQQGLDYVAKVRQAYIESNGHISIIERKQKRHDRPPRKEK